MRVLISDNSQAKIAEIINTDRRKYSIKIGDILRLTIKESKYGKFKKKKEALAYGVVIRRKKASQRSNGNIISFKDNAVVLIDEKKNPIANRVKGYVGVEILNNYNKFESLIKIIDFKQFR